MSRIVFRDHFISVNFDMRYTGKHSFKKNKFKFSSALPISNIVGPYPSAGVISLLKQVSSALAKFVEPIKTIQSKNNSNNTPTFDRPKPHLTLVPTELPIESHSEPPKEQQAAPQAPASPQTTREKNFSLTDMILKVRNHKQTILNWFVVHLYRKTGRRQKKGPHQKKGMMLDHKAE